MLSEIKLIKNNNLDLRIRFFYILFFLNIISLNMEKYFRQ